MKFVATGFLVLTALYGSALAFTARPIPVCPSVIKKTTTTSTLASSAEPKEEEFDNAAIDYLQKFDVSSLTENLDTISKNTMEGEVGQRGEAYAIAQFIVVAAIVIGGVPVVGDFVNILLGPVLLLLGLATMFFSVTDLGKSLSPWPTTTSSTELTTDGLYSQVRHPIYAGLLASCAGLAIFTDSADRLLLTAVLLYSLGVKADLEEAELIKKFPQDYPRYQETVTGKFFPQSILALLPWTKE